MTILKLPPELNLKVIQGPGEDHGLLDLRFFPLTFIKMKGDPSEAYVHAYYRWRKEASAFAHARGMIHAVVKDIDEWGIPKPTIRKMIGEYASADADDVGFAWRYILVTKPIMRGAITAILWIKGDAQRVSFVASHADAIRAAQKLFLDAGCEPPAVDPNTFSPTWA